MAPADLPRKGRGLPGEKRASKAKSIGQEQAREGKRTAVRGNRRSPRTVRTEWTRMPENRKFRMGLDKQRSIGGDILISLSNSFHPRHRTGPRTIGRGFRRELFFEL
jgi:hypothetical protein